MGLKRLEERPVQWLKVWIVWLGKQRITISFESASSGSSDAVQWEAWTSRTRIHFPEGFRKYLRKGTKLMQDDIVFMYTCDPWGRPSKYFYFLLNPFKIRIDWRKHYSMRSLLKNNKFIALLRASIITRTTQQQLIWRFWNSNWNNFHTAALDMLAARLCWYPAHAFGHTCIPAASLPLLHLSLNHYTWYM
jgi:hypothetical protein